MGTITGATADTQASAAGILAKLQQEVGDTKFLQGSPTGGAAFAGAVNDTAGTVAIADNGGQATLGTLQVFVTRPAYINLATVSEAIAYQ